MLYSGLRSLWYRGRVDRSKQVMDVKESDGEQENLKVQAGGPSGVPFQ